jgi:hypothetical protein
MGSWIDACKKELFSIIDYIKKEYPQTKIRVSVVGYKDIKENPNI